MQGIRTAAPALLLLASTAAGAQGLAFNASYDEIDYRAAVEIDHGTVLASSLMPGASAIGGAGAQGIAIHQQGDRTNGLYVSGGGEFTLANSTIDLKGNAFGWDENFGVGAGAMVGANTTLTLRKVTVTTAGIKSSPVASAGLLKVYDSTLNSLGGDVPAENLIPGTGPGYVGPPEALNIRGTARGANVVGAGRAYFYNTRVFARGWGGLSTDSARPHVYLEANDCEVTVQDGGYGTYADIGAEVVMNRTRFHTADYTGVISGTGIMRFTDVTEDRARTGVMIHSPGRDFLFKAALSITGGHLRTRAESILVKSTDADIVLDHARLTPGNHLLLRTEVNASKRAPLLQWLLSDQPDAAPPRKGPAAGISLTLRNMDTAQGIDHADTTRSLRIHLENTRLTAPITGSVWAISDITLALSSGSRWKATADSRLTLAGVTDPAAIDAPHGVTITALAGPGTTLLGRYPLRSGGVLLVKKP